MKKEEAKQYLKIDKLIFNKKTNQIVSLTSQFSDDFCYTTADDENFLWVDNFNGFHVFPNDGATIKIGELEDWEPVNNEKLQDYPTTYCNFLYYRYLQLENRLNNARINY